MRISFRKNFGRALFVMGALTLACWGYLLLEQIWAQRAADRLLKEQILEANRASQRHTTALNQTQIRPRRGDIIGRLEIPRIRLSVIVLEGSDSRILRDGAGHLQGTALPGMMGNVGIAAHRDTFFRPLRDVRGSDIVLLTTSRGVFQYRVEGIEIVDPNDVRVLQKTKDAELTLVTCYPFYYIGPAPKRFIVRARQQG